MGLLSPKEITLGVNAALISHHLHISDKEAGCSFIF